MPIDPSLIKGRWAPPEALKTQEDLVSDTNLDTERNATLVREPIIYEEIKIIQLLNLLMKYHHLVRNLAKR